MKIISSAFEEYSKKEEYSWTLGWGGEKVLAEPWPAAPVALHGANRGHSPPQCPPADTPSSKLQGYTGFTNVAVVATTTFQSHHTPRLQHFGISCAHSAHLTRSVLSQIFYMKPTASATEIVIVTLRFLQLGIRCSRQQVAISLQD